MPGETLNLPPDVGLCASCNARNSKRATRCHACRALLPWAPQPKTEQSKASKPFSAPKISAPSINPEVTTVWGIGLLVFAAAFILPFLGFWMYRYFSNEESPLANFAAVGGLLGVAVIGLGVMGRTASVGSKTTP